MTVSGLDPSLRRPPPRTRRRPLRSRRSSALPSPDRRGALRHRWLGLQPGPRKPPGLHPAQAAERPGLAGGPPRDHAVDQRRRPAVARADTS